MTELIGLLQPFGECQQAPAKLTPATTPSQPNPQKPPPFLHTRFLRLTTSIQQTLVNLAPASHLHLSSEFTAAPPIPLSPSPADKESKPSTSAEKEMEIIRKRRDMLIAKAAQAKAAQAAQALAGGNNAGTHTRDGGSDSPGIFHPPPPLSFPRPPLHTYATGEGMGQGEYGDALRGGNVDGGYYPDMRIRRPAPIHPDNPGGRCHSCGISVTMEWRKGPDGARTLCDSCGVCRVHCGRWDALMADTLC